MGLLGSESQETYYNGDNHGHYQFISLKDIISNFMLAYVGENKVISKIGRADVLFHAQRTIQELSFDTFNTQKSFEVEIGPTLAITFPQDYVDYSKIVWIDGYGVERIMYPAYKSGAPTAPIQDNNFDFTYDEDGDLILGSSKTEERFKSAETANKGELTGNKDVAAENTSGGRYGLEPSAAQTNGVFIINKKEARFEFTSDMVEKIVTIHYVSDGLARDEDTVVHKFAEKAMYDNILFSIVSTRANIPEYIVRRYQKAKFASTRTAKLRLSRLNSEELAQVMRNKSKHIKH